MKKIVLSALLFAAVCATSAHAIVEPQWGANYRCFYDNYSGNATDGGFSVWTQTARYGSGANLLIRCLEDLDTSYGGDTYKCSWAKPVDQANGTTVWEFTFNPYGPQCKKTTVYPPGAYAITFQECTDGHSRTCYRW